MPVADTTHFADLEIRILARRDEGYPVEITFSGEREFPRVHLGSSLTPWVPRSPLAREEGERLFDLLLGHPELGKAWAEARGESVRRRIRLRIDPQAPELHQIPWELLVETPSGESPLVLAASSETPFSRYLAGPWRHGRPVSDRPLRLLVVIANPEDLADCGLAPIDVDEERQNLEEALADEGAAKLEVTFLPNPERPGPVTLAAVEEELRRGYHMLHVVAHGRFSEADDASYLCLADDRNQVEPVRDERIAAMLARQGDVLRLLFLVSCESAVPGSAAAFRGLAPRLIAAGAPAVLAMQDRVAVTTARTFARVFYRQLLAHGLVDVAANEARSTLLTGELPGGRIPGSAIPALFLRLRDGRLLSRPRDEPRKFLLPPLPAASPAEAPSSQETAELLIGRQPELSRLHALFDKAVAQGERQVVFVAGEAGIGKSALLDTFAAQISQDRKILIARGHCREIYGAGEAFLPILEALERVCRGDRREGLVRLLGHYAPTWLAQIPGLLDAAEAAELQQRIAGTAPQRMLRELIAAVEVMTADTPLVLLLEDLHWSDPSTADLVSTMARRPEPARLLLVASFRPTAVLGGDHPLTKIHDDLRIHGHCSDLPLECLSGSAVAEYLSRRLAGTPKDQLSKLIYRLTDGNPLFLVNMVDYLIEQGLVTQIDGRWQLNEGTDAVDIGMPLSLRQMIQVQIAALDKETRQLLQVASVAGTEFAAAAPAAALESEVSETEEDCQRLVRRGQFLRSSGVEEWPDGTLSERYGFRHALYQNVLYHDMPASTRVRLHRRIGARLEAAYGRRADEVAAMLAVHFEGGRDPLRAIEYLQRAARKAQEKSAVREVVSLLRRALELLRTLPADIERDRREIDHQIALGGAYSASLGWAAEESRQAYARAEELCQRHGESERLVDVLAGLWLAYSQGRGDLQKGLQLSREMMRIAEARQDRDQLIVARVALGVSLVYLGEPAAAADLLQQAIALDDPNRDTSLGWHNLEPGVIAYGYLALALMILGYPDQARQRCRDLLVRAASSPTFDRCHAQILTAFVHLGCGDLEAARERAQAVLDLSEKQDFFWAELANVLMAWTLTRNDQNGPAQATDRAAELMARMRGNHDLFESRSRLTGSLPFLVEAHVRCDRPENAKLALEEAFAAVEKTGAQVWTATLHRLRGELTLDGGRDREAEGAAERDFKQALDIARGQQAKLLELRAAISLSRLWQGQGKRLQARSLLAEVYDWFAEGFDTADLKDAKALLDELG